MRSLVELRTVMSSRVATQHRFGIGRPFSLGVEEELLVVDPVDLGLGSAERVFAAAPRSPVGEVHPEQSTTMLELVTPVCECAADVHAVLKLLRRDLIRGGTAMLGAGLHPDGAFGDYRPSRAARHAANDDALRGLLRRTPHCGVHVHVGMPDAETAVRACNGMRKWVPLLQGLAANSPFWHGHDSGLASARQAVTRSLPRTGVPRAFRDYDDYAATVGALLESGELPDYGTVWWELRLHPRLGTLEVRAPDAQSSLRDLTGIVALIHCLVVLEASRPETPGPAPETLDECCFRALRDGCGATLHFEGRRRPLVEILQGALQRVEQIAAMLGCEAELAEVRRMVREGNGAERQRAAHAASGMRGLLSMLQRETHAGCEPLRGLRRPRRRTGLAPDPVRKEAAAAVDAETTERGHSDGHAGSAAPDAGYA